jgi:uncharacterized protein (DUF433 family)
MIAVSNFLGQGLYTPGEVAHYARERPNLVSRWLLGKSGAPVVQRQFVHDDRFVTFLDFVQVLAIANIRRQYAVPLQQIRDAVDEAREFHKMPYPLAMRHTTFLFRREEQGASRKESDSEGDGKRFRKFELLIRRPEESELIQLTGKHRRNYVMKQVVELYLSDLSFDDAGLAVAYTAWRRNNLSIVMDPKRHFGEPFTPSGYSAITLAEAVRTEGSVEHAAKAYGVDCTEVELAVSYLDYLRITPPRE